LDFIVGIESTNQNALKKNPKPNPSLGIIFCGFACPSPILWHGR
jgi:hypothetical protein